MLSHVLRRIECPKCGWPTNTHRSIPCTQCGTMLDIEPGLGDRIERVIDAIGGKQFKRAYRSVFKRDCGCDKRKAQLSAWWRRRYG